jgi:hypothetical protein
VAVIEYVERDESYIQPRNECSIAFKYVEKYGGELRRESLSGVDKMWSGACRADRRRGWLFSHVRLDNPIMIKSLQPEY